MKLIIQRNNTKWNIVRYGFKYWITTIVLRFLLSLLLIPLLDKKTCYYEDIKYALHISNIDELISSESSFQAFTTSAKRQIFRWWVTICSKRLRIFTSHPRFVEKEDWFCWLFIYISSVRSDTIFRSYMNIIKIKYEIRRNTLSHYKVFSIEKRSGGRRTLTALRNREYISPKVGTILETAMSHSSAIAYKTKLSIKKSMLKHNNFKYHYKFDFSDFFGSFTLNRLIRLNAFEENELTNILVYLNKEYKMGQGMITSPAVSNHLMYTFDEKMTKFAEKFELVYSRYADDILLSSNKNHTLDFVKKALLKNLSFSKLNFLKLNNKKCRKMTTGGKVTFLGTVISQDNNLTVGAKRRKKAINVLKLLKKHSVTVKLEVAMLKFAINEIVYINSISKNKIDLKDMLDKISVRQSTLMTISKDNWDKTFKQLTIGQKIAAVNKFI